MKAFKEYLVACLLVLGFILTFYFAGVSTVPHMAVYSVLMVVMGIIIDNGELK